MKTSSYNKETYYILLTSFLIFVTVLILSGCGSSSSPTSPGSSNSSPNLNVKSAANNGAVLSWTPVSGASAYNIYGGTNSTGQTNDFGVQNWEGTISATFSFIALNNGATYYFDVTPVDSNGNAGANSNIVSFTPSGSSLAVTAISGPTLSVTTPVDGDVNLSWAPVNGAIEYDIYENTANFSPLHNGVDYTETSPSPSTATSDTVGGLKTGATYYFYVTAIMSNGEPSSNSNIVSVTP